MMSRDRIKRIAALQMLADLASHVADNSGAGRLRGRCERLERWAMLRMGELVPGMRVTDMAMVHRVKESWGRMAGWHGKARHVGTVVSFLLPVIADLYRDEVRVHQDMQDVYDYYDRVGKCPVQASWAGTIAYLKFEQVMDGVAG